jgi:predicted AlkP superfamily phosphohydrolase/phosphomutase
MSGEPHPLAARRAAIIGLDCAAAPLVFERLAGELPVLSGLGRAGFSGVLTSTTPPITVPAWASMLSGLDPGQLGLYGLRNRRDHSYRPLAVADSRQVDRPRLWDLAGAAGRRSIVLGAPPAYPPPRIRGLMAGCFLSPPQGPFTTPRWLGPRLHRWAGGRFRTDVRGFRRQDRESLLAELREMARGRFAAAGELASREEWDLLVMVEMGLDRVQHAFWRHWDPAHRLHRPGSRFARALPDYYRLLDGLVGGLVERLPADTLVLVVSDHGARPLAGGFCLNQWLAERGWLALRPGARGRLAPEMVDWSRTYAWAEGGYCGRVFLNLAGREPQGALPAPAAGELLAELASELGRLAGPGGQPAACRVVRPEEEYSEVRGVPPDAMVLAGGLDWRVESAVGGGLFTAGEEIGPDDANHDYAGVILGALTGRRLPAPAGGRRLARPAAMADVAPTVLAALGLSAPAGLAGRDLGPRLRP